MNFRVTSPIWLMVLSLAMPIAGCETHPFSGAAAMRIDVEVYKGPLSEEPEIQWGNLWGLLDQAERGLIETDNLTRAVFANKGFLDLRHESPGEGPYRVSTTMGKQCGKERISLERPKEMKYVTEFKPNHLGTT